MQHLPLIALLLSLAAALCAPAGASMKAVPGKLDVPNIITVMWTNIPGFQNDDYIGVVLLTNSTGFVVTRMWANASVSAPSGNGILSVPLLNYRVDFIFKYFRNDMPLLSSNHVAVDAATPLQGHLALTGTPSEMRVMWNSNSIETPTVYYGVDESKLNLTASGISYTYSENELCEDFFNQSTGYWINPGMQHGIVPYGVAIFHVTLTNLTAATLYFYRFGNNGGEGSPIYNFRSAPALGDSSRPITVIAYADLGTSYCEGFPQYSQCDVAAGDTLRGVGALLDNGDANHNLLLHVGDIAYAVGREGTWDQFFTEIEPIATQVPYMVGIGNHEYDTYQSTFRPPWGNYGNDSNGECGVPYSHRFHMPNSTSPAPGEWYSFNYGPIHIVFISTEHDFTTNSTQYNWLQNDFSLVDRSVTPWLILCGHRPMYYTNSMSPPWNDSNLPISYALQQYLEPLTYQYKVDLALWGHVHLYERTAPVYNQTVNPAGTVHVVIGMAGRDLSPADWFNPMPWSIYRELNYGFSRFDVANGNLTFSFIANEDYSVHDTFTLQVRPEFRK